MRGFAFVLALFVFQLMALAPETALAAARGKVRDEGTLEVIIKDSADFKSSRTIFQLRKGGRAIRLLLRGMHEPQGLLSGARVRIKGKRINAGTYAVTGAENFEVISSALAAGVAGTRTAIIIKIRSATAVSSASESQFAQVMSAIDVWARESSFGATSITNDLDGNGAGDVITVQIPDSTAGAAEDRAFSFCNQAQSLALSQTGVDPYRYNHRFCILPPDMTYTWFGQAYLSGSDIVINGNYAGGYPSGYLHELAHNLGMHHSNTPGSEYGESACVMGGNAGTAKRDFNGVHKAEVGWLSVTDATPGTYEINAVEAQPAARVSNATVLRIRDGVSGGYLYVSYRAPLGSLAPGLASPNRLSIHTWPGQGYQSVLLATLGDGETFSRNGITISQAAHTSVSSTVTIAAACSVAAPTVSISPASRASIGLPATYTVTVKNNDVNCSGTSDFSLVTQQPALWTVSLGSSSMSLASGASGSTSMTVAPAAGSAEGTYAIPVTVASPNHPDASLSASYILDVSPPAPVADLRATAARKGKLTLSWSSVTDGGSGVQGYAVYRNGSLLSSVSATSYLDSPGSGTFTYYVVAKDRAGNESAPGNSVQISTASNGRKR